MGWSRRGTRLATCVVVASALVGVVVSSCTPSASTQDAGQDVVSPPIEAGFDADANATGDGSGDASVSGITGTYNRTYYTTSGNVVRPRDLTSSLIEAFVDEGDAGFQTYSGAGHADGTFAIPGVPVVAYTLHIKDVVGELYVESTARAIDLSDYQDGRPDVTSDFLDAGPPSLQANLANLVPWAGQDSIHFTSRNATVDVTMPGGPAFGSTSATFSGALNANLVSADAGDTVVLTQITGGPVDGGFTRVMSSGVTLSDVSTSPGQTTTLDASLAPLSTTAYSGTWKHDTFDQALAAVNPNAILKIRTLIVSSYLGTDLRDRNNAIFPPLYQLRYTSNPGGDEAVSFSFPNPYPNSFPIFLVRTIFNVNVAIPLGDGGLSTPFVGQPTVESWIDLTTATSQPLAAAVAPVQNPVVNGASAFGSLQGVGTTPTISWTAPTTGQNVRYIVDFNEIALVNGATQLAPNWVDLRVYTAATSVRIPPGILGAGKWYLVKIIAESNASDPNARPFDVGLPLGWAATTLSPLSP